MSSSEEDFCDFCGGKGQALDGICFYCNGTGEWNQTAQSYVNNHICQCLMLDRKFCPVCHKPCHHDTSLNPKQVIDDGFGGMGNVKEEEPKKEVEELVIG